MDRYDIYSNDDARIEVEQDKYGDWVRYEDAAVLESENATLRKQIVECEAEINSINALRDSAAVDHWKTTSKMNNRIAELEAAQRWIPVENGLPLDNRCVLVTIADYIEIGWYNISYRQWYDMHGNCLSGIIAWRELPKPYKAASPEEVTVFERNGNTTLLHGEPIKEST